MSGIGNSFYLLSTCRCVGLGGDGGGGVCCSVCLCSVCVCVLHMCVEFPLASLA